ncbi:MAG: 50S ribosome-binding GTPase [Euryarchaeota archaeon]|nr:50S ribosome-binding GTPase [Euryarchaeota archaeon]
MFAALLQRIIRPLQRLFGAGDGTIGIYGAPNAGKTMLANRICQDWNVEAQGSVSEVAHETRSVREIKRVRLASEKGGMTIDIVDTPGLASRVTALDMEMQWGLDSDDAASRARQATEGIVQAIGHLNRVSGLVLVVDSTERPDNPVNMKLLEHAKARKLPVVVAVNKIDLPQSDVTRVSDALREYRIVPISALNRWNFDTFYNAMFEEFRN